MRRTRFDNAHRRDGWHASRQGIWQAYQQGRLDADAATAWLVVLGLAERRRKE